jgi:putative tryptophan/tyrosine transport system substrate-binding protein
MRRRQFIRLLGGAAFSWPLNARARQADKIKRIGFLRAGAPPAAFIDSFRQGLRELGLIDGQNVAIELGLAPNVAQLPKTAAELVRLKVDVIFTSGSPSLVAATKAAGTIPVVFVGAIDPVATGLASSLARPGGNVTGLTAMHADLSGKRLQLLQELLPKLSKVAVLSGAASAATAEFVKEAELAARTFAVDLKVLSARDPAEIDAAIKASVGSDALLVTADVLFTSYRTRIAELALRYRLPTMLGFRELAEAGGLMAYGPHYGDLYRRGAAHVHKILNGARPADLPIEQPTKFEFVINLKTARVLGLTVPPTLLARADEVIE